MSQRQGWSIPPELEQEMTPAVRAFVLVLIARVNELEAKVESLERQLAEARRFERKPPPEDPAASDASSDRPALPRKPPSGKKRGGQPGHQRHERVLIPTSECDDVQILKPTRCRGCGGKLSGSDSDPLRHQVSELPPIQLHVTEYQRHRLLCPCCGLSTCAELPAGVPTGTAGPRLTAFVALLMSSFRLSKSRTAYFLGALLNRPCSPGWIVKLQKLATSALRPAYEELVQKLPRQKVVYADETPTREANRSAWIWTVVATTFTVFAVRLTKAATVIRELLTPKFQGVVVSDRAKMYLWIKKHQWCWAHLKRDFEEMAQRNGKAGRIGRKLLEFTHELFHHWHRARDKLITRRTFVREMETLYHQVYLALEEGTFCAHDATAATCAGLLERYECLWVFQKVQGVEPTNNAAERAHRHAVIWKRLSFGTQSDAGSRFVETLLTVLETCRQQKRKTFEFLTDALTRHFARESAPSLLPGA